MGCNECSQTGWQWGISEQHDIYIHNTYSVYIYIYVCMYSLHTYIYRYIYIYTYIYIYNINNSFDCRYASFLPLSSIFPLFAENGACPGVPPFVVHRLASGKMDGHGSNTCVLQNRQGAGSTEEFEQKISQQKRHPLGSLFACWLSLESGAGSFPTALSYLEGASKRVSTTS